VLVLEPHRSQVARWPRAGRHILAQFDAESVVVYQAFREAIAHEAVALQRFGPTFSRSRMSWIKPNFLWMMYRSGWATKQGQEHVLAVRLRRPFFEDLLTIAVPSSFVPELYSTREDWQTAVVRSDVRLQWDPDHDPSGAPVARRAIQLGLRGRALEEYAEAAVIEIADMSALVSAQRAHARAPFTDLSTPAEHVFVPVRADAAARVGLDAPPADSA
jgi:hypothetical protein